MYNKYVHYTMTLPKTIHLVDKRKDRPMGLRYRPMVGEGDKVVAYEAVPWFACAADRPGETETAEEMADILSKAELIQEVGF